MLAMGELSEGEKTAGKPFLSHTVRPEREPPGMEVGHCAHSPSDACQCSLPRTQFPYPIFCSKVAIISSI